MVWRLAQPATVSAVWVMLAAQRFRVWRVSLRAICISKCTALNRSRQNQAMEYVMRQLSPSYMHKIAQYYEQQVIPYQASKLPADIYPAMLVRGKELVEKGDEARRARMHGLPRLPLTGVKPMIPGL